MVYSVRLLCLEELLLNPLAGSGEHLPGCQSMTMCYLLSVSDQQCYPLAPAGCLPQVKGVISGSNWKFLNKTYVHLQKTPLFYQN